MDAATITATTSLVAGSFALSAYFIGLLSSAVTELFKFIPVLTKYQSAKVLTAVLVMVVGTLISIKFDFSVWDWNLFGQVVMWSFLNYKLIVAPVASDLQLRTQDPTIAEAKTIEENA